MELPSHKRSKEDDMDLTPYLADITRLPEIRRRSELSAARAAERLLRAAHEPLGREHAAPAIAGYWRDVYARDGKVLEVTDFQHNLVVNIFANLVAALCMGNGSGGIGTTYSGIQYMAFGTNVAFAGSPPGETTTEQAGDVGLLQEIYRQVVGSAYFVNSSGAQVTSGTTPNLAISTTVPVGAANAALAEFGLFGGNATAAAGSGFMVDRVTHAIINKPSGSGDFELTRIVTLIF